MWDNVDHAEKRFVFFSKYSRYISYIVYIISREHCSLRFLCLQSARIGTCIKEWRVLEELGFPCLQRTRKTTVKIHGMKYATHSLRGDQMEFNLQPSAGNKKRECVQLHRQRTRENWELPSPSTLAAYVYVCSTSDIKEGYAHWKTITQQYE